MFLNIQCRNVWKLENCVCQNAKKALGDIFSPQVRMISFKSAAKRTCPFRYNSRVNSGLNTIHALQSHRLVLFAPKAKNDRSYDSCISLNHPPGLSDETALSSIVSFSLAQCRPQGLYNPFNRIQLCGLERTSEAQISE